MNDKQSDRRTTWPIAKIVVGTVAVLLLFKVTSPQINSPGVRSPEIRISAEVYSLDGAFKAYKERYGSFLPSDFTRLDERSSPQCAALAQHLTKAFPQCDLELEILAIQKLGVKTPAQALCFWLRGFSSNPQRPISELVLDPRAMGVPLFPFDQSRFRYPAGENSPPVYVPTGGGDAPYVYFASSNYAMQAPFDAKAEKCGQGVANPYRSDVIADEGFVNPKSFQIISAGRDEDYGGGAGSYPSGRGYKSGDQDNLTNFCGQKLGEAIPEFK